MSFMIIDIRRDLPVMTPEDGCMLLFDTGKEASIEANRLTEMWGRKFQPRPAPTGNSKWRERELARFETGEYIQCIERLHIMSKLRYPDHFLHVSKDKPALVAFIKSPAMGEQDRQTRRTVQAYLEEFFQNDTSPASRNEMAAEHVAKFALLDLKWATEPGEIERVYTTFVDRDSGLGASCMRYEVGGENDDGDEYFCEVDEHPVRVYGNSDLRLAYLENDDGYTTARALVYEAKKVYSRVYGGGSSQLHTLLAAAGYRKSATYWSRQHDQGELGPSFHGARIRRVENHGSGGGWLMPYVDAIERAHVSECGRWFVLGSGNIETDPTHGYCEGEITVCCDRCYDRMPEDDAVTVVTDFGGGSARGRWCENCADNYAFRCEGYGEAVSDSLGAVEVDGETFSRRWCENNLTMCEHLNEYMPQGTTFHDVVVRARDWTYNRYSTNSWSQQAVDDNAVWSEAAQMWFTLDKFQFDDVELINGVRHGTPKNFDRGAFPYCGNEFRF